MTGKVKCEARLLLLTSSLLDIWAAVSVSRLSTAFDLARFSMVAGRHKADVQSAGTALVTFLLL